MCEVACAFHHSGKVNNNISRIKVVHLYESGIDGPVVCQQCRERYCLECPEDALSLGGYGQVIVSPTACTLCGRCERACPIGAVTMFDGAVRVCDLCGGSPRCVEACTEGALTFLPGVTGEISLAEWSGPSRKRNPSERRRDHIARCGPAVREGWGRPDA